MKKDSVRERRRGGRVGRQPFPERELVVVGPGRNAWPAGDDNQSDIHRPAFECHPADKTSAVILLTLGSLQLRTGATDDGRQTLRQGRVIVTALQTNQTSHQVR